MCLGCECPQPLPPPNQTIQKCRLMLQILAGGLLFVGLVGIIASLVFQFIYDLLLIYMLYVGWTTFNWCMTLAFFMFCTVQTVQSAIVFIGMVQYGRFFDKTNLILTFYCIVSLVYYPLAVYFSHFCYKNFKNSFKGNNQLLPRNGLAGNNDGQVSGGGNYQRVVQQQQGQPPVFGRRNDTNQQRNNNSNQFFGGQGVRIG